MQGRHRGGVSMPRNLEKREGERESVFAGLYPGLEISLSVSTLVPLASPHGENKQGRWWR